MISDDPSQNIDRAESALAAARGRVTGELPLHHVGIVAADASLFETFYALTGVDGEPGGNEIAFRHVPEFQCDCYLVGRIELVVPNGPQMEGSALHRWLLSRGRSLHHIAFEVSDLDEECTRLRRAGVPVVLNTAVDGVARLRVNFIHPSYCGFLVELVEST